MTPLRKRMLEELQRRNYAQLTIDCYIQIVEDFSKHFGRRPDQLGAKQLREYQVYLFRERKLSRRTVSVRVSALRFFFVKMLKRAYMIEYIPFPKQTRTLPAILTPQEVTRLIEAASNLMHRAMLMMLYATGICGTQTPASLTATLLQILQKGAQAYQQQTGLPLDPSLLHAETTV